MSRNENKGRTKNPKCVYTLSSERSLFLPFVRVRVAFTRARRRRTRPAAAVGNERRTTTLAVRTPTLSRRYVTRSLIIYRWVGGGGGGGRFSVGPSRFTENVANRRTAPTRIRRPRVSELAFSTYFVEYVKPNWNELKRPKVQSSVERREMCREQFTKLSGFRTNRVSNKTQVRHFLNV